MAASISAASRRLPGSICTSNSLLFGASGSWPFSARPICSATLLTPGMAMSPFEICAPTRVVSVERDAGAQRGVRDQVILAKIRQQARAEQRQEHDSGDARSTSDDGDEHARPALQPGDGAQLAALAVAAGTRASGLRLVPRHDQHAQRRRRAHGHQQRQAHRQQERRSTAAGRMRPAIPTSSGWAGMPPPRRRSRRTPAAAPRAKRR